MPAAPAPRRRGRGCLVVAMIAAGGLVFGLAVLAAIAIPAYADYVARTRVTQALSEAAAAKLQVAAFRIEHGRCPRADDPGFGPVRPPPPGSALAAIALGTDAAGGCTIELTLRGEPDALEGRHLRLAGAAGGGAWTCSTDLAPRYRPSGCRD